MRDNNLDFGDFTESLLTKKPNKNGKSFSAVEQKTIFEYKQDPLISVIIPVYMEEKILEDTLKIFTNELKVKYNFELIVSDGGSNDKTIQIAEKFADFVVTHKLERKQTISEGRNNGAAIARGKTFVFINGDTVPENPDSFFKFITDWTNSQDMHKNSVALACKVAVSPNEIIFRDKIFYSLHNLYVNLLNIIGLGMGRGECQIVNAQVFNNIGGYNPNIVAGEDFDLYRRISKKYKIEYLNNVKVYESPRRFRKYGYLKTIASWTLNSLSVWFCGRSVSGNWEAVR